MHQGTLHYPEAPEARAMMGVCAWADRCHQQQPQQKQQHQKKRAGKRLLCMGGEAVSEDMLQAQEEARAKRRR